MKKSLLCIIGCFLQLHLWAASPITVSELRCENLTNPLAIDNLSPRFSWKIRSDVPMRQQSYEIQVGSDSLSLTKSRADLWQSGRVEGDASVMVPYQGKALKPRQLCYWRVRVWNERGETSAWSGVERFAIGVAGDDPLKGDYIGLAAGDVRAPLLRKSFGIDRVTTAFLHVNSLGYHEVYINGRKADDRVLAPAVSQLNKRSLIVTYDLTPYLRQGTNELLVWLGQGWYKPTTFGAEYPGPVVKAEMDLLQNGEWTPVVTTDATWTGRESGYSDTGTWQALRFGGERIDGRLLPASLRAEALNRLEWKPVAVVPVTPHAVSPQTCEPDKKQETLTPKSIEALGPDTWLVDMGKVLTGWFELHIPSLASGHEITVSYSDAMGKDGLMEEQGEQDLYIASGSAGGDTFCNKFNHHAFRYVKIAGLSSRPTHQQIRAYLIHGDYRPAATFRCSDNELNAIHDMVSYTLRCLTFSGYMVDCPHLERTGYGGDGNSSTQILQTLYDVSPTYMNWLQAWKDVMREGGSLPHVAPNPGAGGGGPYWCGFIVLAPWRTYVNYGDPRLIERCYDTMKEWMGYVDHYTVDGLLKRWPDTPYRDWYLGDWLAPAGVDAGAQASIDLVNNCFISECLDALRKIASVLGKPDDAEKFEARRTELNRLIHQTFYREKEGIYATGSQLDMTYPMWVGAVPDTLYAQVKERLIARSAAEYKGHIAVGLVGVPILTDWAIRNKEADFMYGMLKQPDYPGYLHMIRNNATTTWEYWNGERSRVHNCYNGIGNWFYQAVGGLRTDDDEPGYRHVWIEPQIPQGVTWAHTTKETPYGTIGIDWALKERRFTMHLVLPVGVRASVAVPEKARHVLVNGREVKPEKPYLELGTGSYDIAYEQP